MAVSKHRPVVGIIGTGGISHAHAPGWKAVDAELHCFSVAGAEEFAKRHGAQVHSSLESLLDAVELVDVCTPTPAHPEQVHAALDAGVHVICEKPLALSVEEAESMIAHARRAGKMLIPAHVVRYFPQYRAAKNAIDAGRLGELAVLRFERTGAMPTQPWFADESRSGGIVMDQMIHDIDQAIWMAGPVRATFAQQSIAPSTDRVRTAHVILTHESGAISHCRGLWGPPGTAFQYTFSLAGTDGRLEYDSAADTGVSFDHVARARSDAGESYIPSAATFPDPYASEIRSFAEAITGGEPALVTAHDGSEAVRISRAALESIATGKAIAC